MKAFILKRYGKREKFQLAEVAEPVVLDYDILVQLHSAGANLLDSKTWNGEFKMILPYDSPITLGHDGAGVAIEVGSVVSTFNQRLPYLTSAY